jgi:hypothetical protein
VYAIACDIMIRSVLSSLANFGIAVGWKWSIAKIETMKRAELSKLKYIISGLSVYKHKPHLHLNYRASVPFHCKKNEGRKGVAIVLVRLAQILALAWLRVKDIIEMSTNGPPWIITFNGTFLRFLSLIFFVESERAMISKGELGGLNSCMWVNIKPTLQATVSEADGIKAKICFLCSTHFATASLFYLKLWFKIHWSSFDLIPISI